MAATLSDRDFADLYMDYVADSRVARDPSAYGASEEETAPGDEAASTRPATTTSPATTARPAAAPATEDALDAALAPVREEARAIHKPALLDSARV